MRNLITHCAVMALVGLAGMALSCAGPSKQESVAVSGGAEPLFDNLGTLHHPITTRDPSAQRYFDQGLRLVYAFSAPRRRSRTISQARNSGPLRRPRRRRRRKLSK